MNHFKITAIVMVAILTLWSARLSAKDHEVKMLNSGAGGTMVFEPALVRIAPGDSVTFTTTDAGHNAESIPTMTPAGSKPFKGEIGRPVTVTFSRPGLYGYKCRPHYAFGMVGLVQVGATVDRPAAVAAAGQLPGLAKIRMARLVADVR